MTRHELLFKIEGHVYRRFLAPHFTIIDDREGLPAPPEDVRQRVRVMVTSGAAGASRQDIAALPELALICCVGTGYENVDVEAARERGIVVTYGAGANASAVADHAFALLLAAMRDIPRFHSLAVTGQWRGDGRSRPIPTGKKLGLIGLGAIGERVARRAAGFEMAVSYHSRTPKPEAPWRYVDSVLRLAEEVDCLVVAVPGGASTFHMIDATVLAALGPAGFLVNVGRGSVVDTEALVAALQSGARRSTCSRTSRSFPRRFAAWRTSS